MTAQQFDTVQIEEEGMEVEKQEGQPCQPWDLPWPAPATPPQGAVSSAWLMELPQSCCQLLSLSVSARLCV